MLVNIFIASRYFMRDATRLLRGRHPRFGAQAEVVIRRTCADGVC